MDTKQIIILSLFLTIVGCGKQQQKLIYVDKDFITSKIWNLSLTDTSNYAQLDKYHYTIYRAKYKDAPLFFDKGILYFGNGNGGEDSCIFLHDTIIMTKSYYTSARPGIHVTDTTFMGIVTKLNKDSLVIRRIKDALFNFILGDVQKCKTAKFYNDEILMKNKTKFKVISLSCGYCYGTCPKLAIEIDSIGTLHIFGGGYAFKKGYYKGLIGKSSIDSMQQLLSAGLINRDSFKYYGIRDDSQETEMIIILQDNDTIIIDGDTWDYNYRLNQLCWRLRNSIKIDSIVKDTNEFKFLAKKYILNQN
jgi:hypothetical protein